MAEAYDAVLGHIEFATKYFGNFKKKKETVPTVTFIYPVKFLVSRSGTDY